MPLTNDEIQGDPRLTTGTGTVSAGFDRPINDATKTPGDIKELNLQTVYNLKKLRDKKTNAEHKFHPTEYSGKLGENGPTETVSRTGKFTENPHTLEIFDNYLLYKDGRIKNKNTKKPIRLNKEYVVINKMHYNKDQLYEKYADFLKN